MLQITALIIEARSSISDVPSPYREYFKSKQVDRTLVADLMLHMREAVLLSSFVAFLNFLNIFFRFCTYIHIVYPHTWVHKWKCLYNLI